VDTDFSYKSIYISEASFGNDMTNLCRFTLKKPKQLKNFVPFSQLNKKKKDDIEKFYNTDWGDHEDDDSFDSVNEELSSLRSSPKTRYIHHNISNDMSYELYIYNEEMNVGYYVVLIF
jgi:thymidylate synthase